jgi:hypothetical protein
MFSQANQRALAFGRNGSGVPGQLSGQRRFVPTPVWVSRMSQAKRRLCARGAVQIPKGSILPAVRREMEGEEHVQVAAPTSAFSSMPSPPISATSCARDAFAEPIKDWSLTSLKAFDYKTMGDLRLDSRNFGIPRGAPASRPAGTYLQGTTGSQRHSVLSTFCDGRSFGSDKAAIRRMSG